MNEQEHKEIVKQLKELATKGQAECEYVVAQCDKLLLDNPHDGEIFQIYSKMLSKLGRVSEVQDLFLRFNLANFSFVKLILSFFVSVIIMIITCISTIIFSAISGLNIPNGISGFLFLFFFGWVWFTLYWHSILKAKRRN